jgi:hypothetical protein
MNIQYTNVDANKKYKLGPATEISKGLSEFSEPL